MQICDPNDQKFKAILGYLTRDSVSKNVNGMDNVKK